MYNVHIIIYKNNNILLDTIQVKAPSSPPRQKNAVYLNALRPITVLNIGHGILPQLVIVIYYYLLSG